MGSRPSSFKSGGGFLNDVDATFVGYKFSNSFNDEGGVDGEKTPLYFIPEFRVDGSEEPVSTNLYAGSGEIFTISKDKRTLTYGGDDASIWSKSGAALFLTSIIEAKPELEASLSDVGEPINYEPLIGLRLRLTQQTDEEATKKLGPRKDAKTGKSYPRTNLVATKVYGVVPVAPARPTAAKAGGKVAGKATPTVSGDVTAIAQDTLIAVIEAAGGSIARNRVKLPVFRALDGNPAQDAVQKLVTTDDFINSQAGWTVSEDGKTLSL